MKSDPTIANQKSFVLTFDRWATGLQDAIHNNKMSCLKRGIKVQDKTYLANYTWNILMTYTLTRLKDLACQNFWRGLEKLSYDPYQIPDLNRIRDLVFVHTGWMLYRAHGEVPAVEFLAMLARKEFPLVWELRPTNQVFAATDPDLWHELIGHIPLLFDARVQDLYWTIGQAANNANPETILLLIRLYWFVAEYGLILENSCIKIFGAGLLASPLGANAIQNKHVKIRKLTARNIIKEKYNPYSFQKNLFLFTYYSDVLRIIDVLCLK